jgi:TPR repeat protein
MFHNTALTTGVLPPARRNQVEAVKRFRLAAEQGHTKAQQVLKDLE